MTSLLLIIDLEKSFINDNTKFLIPKIKNLIDTNNYDLVAFTKFVNTENSRYVKDLNWHGCIKSEDQEIALNTKDYPIFRKNIYTAYNEELKKFILDNDIQIVYLCGIDTDACVMKTAIDLWENNINVKILKDYSMNHDSKEFHYMALRLLEKLIGKKNIL